MQESQAIKPKAVSTNGNSPRIVLQARDLRLFGALATLRLVDRRQAALLGGFASVTRVNARLLKLKQSGLLKRFFFVSALGGKRAIYCLSKKGAEVIGILPNGINRTSDSFLIGDKFVAHQLAINEVYCAARTQENETVSAIKNWRTFSRPLSVSVLIIPDSYFEIHTSETVRPMFLEVDQGTEGLPVWNKKINQYIALATSGEFDHLFQRLRFAVLVVAPSERRVQ